ncbi:cobalt transporter CbiM [Sinimarinibacterium flocculans]|uniref:Cobalt/nickel transport system permease protein n=1 Tax=Sinimarinibacterium flocculans TaxID=985250 RepID=A0A318ED44_9GAMM|nr:cobalt transporter CbiM [Sinimarinibacterium flocculans]PXV65681.1 cobalt/nickel transport system permease protein [Sinimarinibacterium flocculans]
MHISEGVLSVPVLAGGAMLAAGAIAVGLKKLPDERIPQAGMLCAMFFVASLIHLPVGVSAVHLVLNGLCGVLLGWAAFPVIAVALLLQALLFGFGGLSVLGANIVVMGVPAVLCSCLFHAGFSTLTPHQAGLRGALAGGGAVALGIGLMTLALWLSSGTAYWPLIGTVLLAHLPVMAAEAAVTGAVVFLLARTRPTLLAPALT